MLRETPILPVPIGLAASNRESQGSRAKKLKFVPKRPADELYPFKSLLLTIGPSAHGIDVLGET